MTLKKIYYPVFVGLLACAVVLGGCSEMDSAEVWDGNKEASGAESGSSQSPEGDSCESYEAEVEPGVCSYIVDCDDAASCEIWGAAMIGSMEEWLGDLTYSEEWDVDERESEKEADVFATYKVEDNEIDLNPANEDEEYYAWLWDRFAWIIPSDQRNMISGFELYDHADIMAYVVQDEDDYESWIYAANQVQATYETERIMTDIHEFGHLLSLNADQLDPYADETECGTLMLDEGCAYEEAYIYNFHLQFWEDGESGESTDYVSDYAMSSLYEDFAESWAYFVMTDRPSGSSGADRKTAFFYDYDELIMLKAALLGRMASWIDRNVEA